MIREEIINASREISKLMYDKEKEAITSLRIFILGSYKSSDKKYLEDLRDKLHKKDIKAFLMEDIITEGEDLKVKFDAIWSYMQKGSEPLLIMFASDSAGDSQGFISEVVDIANDKDKIEVAHLYKTESVKLPSHAKCFINCHPVPSGEMFVKSAITLVESKIANIKNFLSYDER